MDFQCAQSFQKMNVTTAFHCQTADILFCTVKLKHPYVGMRTYFWVVGYNYYSTHCISSNRPKRILLKADVTCMVILHISISTKYASKTKNISLNAIKFYKTTKKERVYRFGKITSLRLSSAARMMFVLFRGSSSSSSPRGCQGQLAETLLCSHRRLHINTWKLRSML